MPRQSRTSELTADRISEQLSTGWETAREKAAVASQALAPRLEAAKAAASPYLETARERIGPAVETARDRLEKEVAPAVAAAMTTAMETSAPARAEAKERAANVLLALRGELPEKKRRWPMAMTMLALGATAGAVVGVVARRMATQPPLTPPTPFPAREAVPVTPDVETAMPSEPLPEA